MSYPKLYPLIKDGRYGLQDSTGLSILSPKYDYIQISDDERLLYRIDDKWGLLDRQGKVIVSHTEYSSIYASSYGFHEVTKNGKYGLIDANGKVIIPPVWDICNICYTKEGFSQPLLIVYRDDYYGVINLNSKIIIPLEYEYIGALQDGLFSVTSSIDYKDGVMDEKGSIIIPMEYDGGCIDMADNGLIIASRNGKFGCINLQNRTVIPFKYKDIKSCGPELCAVQLSEKPELWNCINKAGDLLLNKPFQEIEYLEGEKGISDSMTICSNPDKKEYFALTSKGLRPLPSDNHAVYTPDGKTIIQLLDLDYEVTIVPGVENICLADRFTFLCRSKVRKLTFKPGVTHIGKGWENFTDEHIDIVLPASLEKVDSEVFIEMAHNINAIYVPKEAFNHIIRVLPRYLVPLVKENRMDFVGYILKIWGPVSAVNFMTQPCTTLVQPILSKVSINVGKILSAFILFPIFVMSAIGYIAYSHTMSVPHFAGIDLIILIAIIASITARCVKAKYEVKIFSTFYIFFEWFILIYAIGSIFLFAVFYGNKSGGDEPIEIPAKITEVTRHMGRNTYYSIEVEYGPEQKHLSTNIGKDCSFRTGQNCIVIYHKGRFGWNVLDKVEHTY